MPYYGLLLRIREGDRPQPETEAYTVRVVTSEKIYGRTLGQVASGLRSFCNKKTFLRKKPRRVANASLLYV